VQAGFGGVEEGGVDGVLHEPAADVGDRGAQDDECGGQAIMRMMKTRTRSSVRAVGGGVAQ